MMRMILRACEYTRMIAPRSYGTDMICSDGFVKCFACLSTRRPASTVAMTVKTAAMMMASV